MPNTLRKVGSDLLKVGGSLNIWDGTGDPCCCGPNCALCDGSTPEQMEVVFAGILDLGGTGCSDCVAVNGTWVLDNFTVGASECHWQSDAFELCGDSTTRVRMSITGTYTLKVWLTRTAGSGIVSEWRLTQGGLFECDSFSSLDVPPFSETVNCDIFTTPSTCSVTAL